MFTKTVSLAKTRPSSGDSIGYQYVTHSYKLFGVTFYKCEEILALAP